MCFLRRWGGIDDGEFCRGFKSSSADTFGAIGIMVMITTLITPPFLKWAMGEDIDKSEIDNDIIRLPSEK